MPYSLKIWFIIHFAVDLIFAVPLIFFPEQILPLFGFDASGSFFARLVGAALIGIGGNSLHMHGKGPESFYTMLILKILWSGAAIISIFLELNSGGPSSLWFFLSVFIIFNGVWCFFAWRLKTS